MNFKLLILSLTISSSSTLKGQNLKIDTFKTISPDTSLLVRWQCHAGQSVISKNSYPLVIINGKKFKNCLLQNIFFNLHTTNILAVRVLNPQNNSTKFYGRAGKYGVIIIKTKKPIEWISAKQILTQKSNDILSTPKKTLIKVDQISFGADEELYFQKDLINNIVVVNNTTEYYVDRQYNSLVKITMTKKRGT